MPLNFDSLRKLLMHAELLHFRPIEEEETVAQYRIALAQRDKDPVQAMEIFLGKGWDRWTDGDVLKCVARFPETAQSNPMIFARLLKMRARRTPHA